MVCVAMNATLVVALLSLAGCEFNQKAKPSILIIAVERLGFDSLSCDSEQVNEPGFAGLRALCDEFVRFSHAYAPSTLGQSALASILTGLYPVDHGVHHNGSDYLSARFSTVAKAAQSKHYRTLFASGGPPIWRKSGLAQGYEVFDDVVELSPGMYYRPVDDVFRIFTHWLDHDVSGQPFLATVFLADLQFPQVATRSKEGEVREKSAAAQLEQIMESFGSLVKWMKARRVWHTTSIIVVGLNALGSTDTELEPAPLSLRSDSVQVSLFIKPSRKDRDEVMAWAIDRNVSLVDVGATVFQWLGADIPLGSWPELQSRSLASALTKPEPDWAEDRLIISETGWPEWLENAGIRWSVRQKKFLYIHDHKPLIYNTLIDRMESLAIKPQDPLWASLNAGILSLMQKVQVPVFSGMDSNRLEMLQVARELWIEGSMARSVQGDEPWLKWYLREALAKRDWAAVRKLSVLLNDPVGVFVAARHLGENAPLPKNPCLRMLLQPRSEKKAAPPDCEDERVLAIQSWQQAKSEEDKAAAQERFARLYLQHWMDQDIGRLNYLNQLRWDVDREFPEAPRIIDYLITLKEFEGFARKALGAVVLLNPKDGRL